MERIFFLFVATRIITRAVFRVGVSGLFFFQVLYHWRQINKASNGSR